MALIFGRHGHKHKIKPAGEQKDGDGGMRHLGPTPANRVMQLFTSGPFHRLPH